MLEILPGKTYSIYLSILVVYFYSILLFLFTEHMHFGYVFVPKI